MHIIHLLSFFSELLKLNVSYINYAKTLFVCIQQRIQTNNAQCHKGIPQTQYTEDFKGQDCLIFSTLLF